MQGVTEEEHGHHRQPSDRDGHPPRAGDLRAARLADELLVRGGLRRGAHAGARGARRGGPQPRHVPAAGRRARRARERLLAPADAVVEGRRRGRRRRLRLPRPGLQLRGPLHVHAVAEDDQPGRPRARYPVVERHRFVWVWPGDPALADPGLVPDLHWNDDPEWAGDGKRIHLDAATS